jgi:beta-lactam-binding protein with PASTA domain
MPRVVGQSGQQAVATLRALGLSPTTATVRSSQPRGTVVGQNPGSGTKLARGRPVRLTLAAGPPSAPTPVLVAVPDVRNTTLAAARRQIRQAGLVTEVHTVPSREPAGTVVAQSPLPGGHAKRGSHVLVNASQGAATPSLVAIPDVVGQDEASALATLRQAGFTVDEVDVTTTDQSQDGVVVDQQPGSTRATEG